MRKAEHVLVVDDFPDTLEMVSIALDVVGYGVLRAASGREALRVAKTSGRRWS
jgi:CheY-like chemotaxis protein